MHDLQNKELTKFVICNRLILRSLHFCGQVERCTCRKNEFIQEMRAGKLLGPFGLLIAKLSTKISMSHIKKNVKKNVGEAGISHNGLKSGDLRLVAFAEARRKTASMDAGAPERG